MIHHIVINARPQIINRCDLRPHKSQLFGVFVCSQTQMELLFSAASHILDFCFPSDYDLLLRDDSQKGQPDDVAAYNPFENRLEGKFSLLSFAAF